jgi:hypothetical protein
MSGNYQSQVFTFINKRTNQLKDTCAQGLRHLKVAVVWSSQILLYPLHLLAQTTKLFQPQFSAPPSQQLLTQPVPDINIEEALDLVAGAGYPISLDAIAEHGAITAEDSSSQSLSQQFLPRESTLAILDRNSWNIEHSNIDPEDWELVDNARKSRRVTTRKPIIRGLSSLLIDRQLVLVTSENELLDLLTPSQQQEIRRRIGIDLAIDWHRWHRGELAQSQLPSKHLLKNRHRSSNNETLTDRLAIAGTNETNDKLVDRDRQLPSSTFFDTSIEQLRQSWDSWLQKFTTKTSEPSESKSLPQLPSTNYSFSPQPPQISRWLDLPQLPPIVEPEPLSSQVPMQNPLVKLQPDWLKQWWNYYRDYLHIPAKSDSQIVAQLTDFQLIPLIKSLEIQQSQNGMLAERVSKHNRIDRDSSKLSKRISEDLEYQPDWIEAESETIGYNQSPIAKFLAWLDRIFFQIENWLIKIWTGITNNPRRS